MRQLQNFANIRIVEKESRKFDVKAMLRIQRTEYSQNYSNVGMAVRYGSDSKGVEFPEEVDWVKDLINVLGNRARSKYKCWIDFIEFEKVVQKNTLKRESSIQN